MSRSIKKGPYVQEALMKRVLAMNEAGEKKVLKTWSRSSTIFPDFVGHTFAVHDGRKHVPVHQWRQEQNSDRFAYLPARLALFLILSETSPATWLWRSSSTHPSQRASLYRSSSSQQWQTQRTITQWIFPSAMFQAATLAPALL